MTDTWKLTARELLIAYGEGMRDFSGANLYGANLSRANLYGANLDGANLDGANLDGANLYGANLSRANLSRANLDGANLDGANLYGANLDGANLPDNFHVLQFGPVGSRKSYTVATVYPDVHEIRTGCFRGSLEEFIAAVQKKPEGDPFRAEYENMVIPAIHWFFQQHTQEEKES